MSYWIKQRIDPLQPKPKSQTNRTGRLPLHKAAKTMLAGLLLWGSATAWCTAGLFASPVPEQPAYAAELSAASLHAADVGELAGAGTVPDSGDAQASSWLLKWHGAPPAVMPPGTRLLQRQAEPPVDVVAPAGKCMDKASWLEGLRASGSVDYVQPNERVHILALPSTAGTANDPYLAKQAYLDQIGAKKAWKTVHDQTNLTIALVDTGVDLNHPDLKKNLVGGVNLIRPGQQPQDDNGHGTSVAGVLAAAGGNGTGVAGVLWNARIMPIKALDADGSGDESKLGEGIMYAVRKGAKIVVLSVGLYRYSPYMRDIVQYAENNGVLLIAATGNDGELLGSRAAVKFPAAYPTVLAIGGTQPNGKPEPRSNPGPEVDLAAPWNVYTTALGGSYKREEGTSMAAPQAAAAAALALARHPNLKPYEVRELLRQTAKDIGPAGLDEASGYGLLQIDKAVSAELKPDAYEPNDSRDRAALLPLQTQVLARLTGGLDHDWYVIDAPYDGKVTVQLQGLIASSGTAMPPVRMTMYTGNQAVNVHDAKLLSTTVEWNVKKGRNQIRLQLSDNGRTDKLPYLMTANFRMNADAYESNEKYYEAKPLQPQTQVLTGTFDKQGDRDWFVVDFKRSGTLQLKVQTDTVRIDPSLAVQREGQKLVAYDDNGDGEVEQSPLITVTPGKYYIRIYNAAAIDASPVTGLYTLRMDIVTKYDDPNEPNDQSYASTALRSGTEYVGVIGSSSDADWYQLRLTGKNYATIDLGGIPTNRTMTVNVYDKRQKKLRTLTSKAGQTRLYAGFPLEAGLYYFKITANAAFDQQYYRFTVRTEQLSSGYRDIDGHWAEAAIAALTKDGILSGYADYRFAPDRAITRAEGAALLVRAFSLKSQPMSLSFRDLSRSHWAYSAIATAVGAGYLNGYPDRSFGPDRLMTREEMAVMLGSAAGVRPAATRTAPFADIGADNWAAPMLAALRSKGWIGGFEEDRYMPELSASRAQFAALLYRIRSSRQKSL